MESVLYRKEHQTRRLRDMNIVQKLKENIAALRICLSVTGKLTPVQVETVRKFNGWGMAKCVLYNPDVDSDWTSASVEDKKLRPLVKELHQLLSDEMKGKEYKVAVESIKNAVLTSFYTPEIVVTTFYKVLKQYHHVGKLYEPSGGSGVFVLGSRGILPLEEVIVYEKDLLTGKILEKLLPAAMNIPVTVHIDGFENSGVGHEFDALCTNPPYGAFPVYDPAIDKELCKKIHNYFVAKGLTKLREGGIMAYLITSAFLDTVSNKSAREYLFSNADFISLTVMPDNLMKESAGTEAGSHFLVVRKHTGKTEMSAEEKLLCVSENIQIAGKVTVSRNKYIETTGGITIGTQRVGTNQYGKPSVETWWHKPIQDIAEPFREILSRDFRLRYKDATMAICWPPESYVSATKGVEPGELKPEWNKSVGIWTQLQEGKESVHSDTHLTMFPVLLKKHDDTPPWKETLEELIGKDVQLPKEQVSDIEYQIEDEEETARLRDMADMEMGEGDYADESENKWEAGWKPGEQEGFSQAGLTISAVQMELIPDPQKGWSKRDRQVHEAYVQIRDTLNELELKEKEQI